MTPFSLNLIMCAVLGAASGALPAAALDPARQGAPADGYAGQEGGTIGGARAGGERIYSASTRAELLAAIDHGGAEPKIIKISGIIDMSEARPFASSADQRKRSAVNLPSNTTLIGVGRNAGFVNASVHVAQVSQVIIRNLHFRNPCDVGPVWDPRDGASGNWNSLFDSITIAGSHHVWIDHNSFTDAPATDDTFPLANGMRKQCHDGALDIGQGSDFVTVSYNHFAQHEKNMLIGSGDRATGDAGRLHITLSNNLFEHVAERSPRVRYGRVHLFNNYYLGERRRSIYPHKYSLGIGHQSQVLSHQNLFDVAGAGSCADVVRNPGTSAPGTFSDSGSVLNGQALAGCPFAPETAAVVPYSFSAQPAARLKTALPAQAGAGKLDATPAAALAATPGKWEAHAGGGVIALLAPGTQAALKSDDFYIEARIRALPGSTAAQRQLYLLGRYVDAGNWFGAGLTLGGPDTPVQADLVRMQGGTLSRLKNVKRSIVSAGRFLTVRFEMIGQSLTVYLNGEKLSTGVDPAFTARGQLGLYASERGFEIDNVRVGDPAQKPMRLAPSLAGHSFTAQAGDPPQPVRVAALAGDGITRERFSARSSDPSVLTVSTRRDGISVTAKRPGTASIVLASVADPTVQSIIDATITAPFAMSTQRLALGKAVFPAAGAAAVPVDTPLRLDFDSAPTLGAAGAVRIYRKAGGKLVDIIRLGDGVGVLGYTGQAQVRAVRHRPISVSGNSVTIRPNRKLDYGTDYLIAVGEGVIHGATLAGQPFGGIGKAAQWQFRTRAAAPSGTSLVVDDDGPADFATVQGALNHAMQHIPRATPATISIRNGKYEEMLFIRGKDQLTLRGESRDGVLIHYANHDSLNPGSGLSQAPGSPGHTGGRSLLMIEDADLLTLETLTLKNTTLRARAASAQAETLYFNNDAGRLTARDASFISEQDTIQVKGYAWFYRTLVAGNVDFIWGANRAALFEDSEIRSLGDSANPASGGYVLQARTVAADDRGFVFMGSRLTQGPGPAGNSIAAGASYLARSPGTASTWDNISFINCAMDSHIAPLGWYGKPPPNPLRASATRGWREHGSTDLAGKPLDLAARVGGYQLSPSEVAARYANRAMIFSNFGDGKGWNPQP